ncbi:transaldolase [Candidatus Daviesbacteria bacterium]|nr:transaldolase [Candidatus Daviesbacteria bacterium]
MKSRDLKTKIFLDGGDPDETREIQKLLGFLDGQTTNPTLISKNPEVAKRLAGGEKFNENEAFGFYKRVVQEISHIIPGGSISVEVYADQSTTSEEMLRQGREMFSWVPNAHVKYPTSSEGLRAAEISVKDRLRVNMTLCFSQEQAAAVYRATEGAKRGQVYVSPFIGRLDDRGENGMDLIKNIIDMYEKGDGHVLVLTASVRNLDHFLYAIKLGSDIITAPFKILKEWAEKGMLIPDSSYQYKTKDLKDIPYQELNLSKGWQEFNISHDLTDKGIERFSKDWNALITR